MRAAYRECSFANYITCVRSQRWCLCLPCVCVEHSHGNGQCTLPLAAYPPAMALTHPPWPSPTRHRPHSPSPHHQFPTVVAFPPSKPASLGATSSSSGELCEQDRSCFPLSMELSRSTNNFFLIATMLARLYLCLYALPVPSLLVLFSILTTHPLAWNPFYQVFPLRLCSTRSIGCASLTSLLVTAARNRRSKDVRLELLAAIQCVRRWRRAGSGNNEVTATSPVTDRVSRLGYLLPHVQWHLTSVETTLPFLH